MIALYFRTTSLIGVGKADLRIKVRKKVTETTNGD
jgi:hypothetical protein